jgi:osmoprotectant transport system permease protein
VPDQGDGSSRVSQCNCVAIFGATLGLLSLVLPWLTIRPSRLAAGDAVWLWSAIGPLLMAAFLAAWLVALRAGFEADRQRGSVIFGVAGALLAPATLAAAGFGSTRLLEFAEAVARSSLSAGVWLGLLAAYVLVHTAARNLSTRPRLRALLIWTPIVLIVVGAVGGAYSDTSLAREFAGNEGRFVQELGRHISLSLGSVAIGTCIAIPLGIAAARSTRAERPIFVLASTIETIPSLALFGLMIAPLSALSHAYPALREIGIRGVGTAPALIALVLYSLLPIVHNTYVGLKEVSPAAMDAGRGMGMSRSQLARKVEFPLAAPLIAEGVRTATVQSVGGTVVAALIGAGGLGHFIFQGLGQAASDLILMGALPVIALALIVDIVMRWAIAGLTSKGLRAEAAT